MWGFRFYKFVTTRYTANFYIIEWLHFFLDMYFFIVCLNFTILPTLLTIQQSNRANITNYSTRQVLYNTPYLL